MELNIEPIFLPTFLKPFLIEPFAIPLTVLETNHNPAPPATIPPAKIAKNKDNSMNIIAFLFDSNIGSPQPLFPLHEVTKYSL